MLSKKALRQMDDEEIREVSLQKNAKGNATKEALMAQQELYDRAHPFGEADGCRPDDVPYGRDRSENVIFAKKI